MKRFRFSAVCGLAHILTLACSSGSQEEPVAPKQPVESAPVVQLPEESKRTPREKLDQYKQEQHDLLYASLLQGQTIEQFFSSLPETMQYHDKRTWAVKKAGPLQYLFDLRAVNTPAHTDNSLLAYLYLWGDILHSVDARNPLCDYRENVTAKAAALGLGQEYDIALLESRPLLPLYETIQHPSEQDIGIIYDALGHVPQFIGKPFVSTSLASDFDQAEKLFADEPALYVSKKRMGREGEISLPSPAHASEPITTTRYPDGELRIPERAYGSAVKQSELVFPWEIEKNTTPFAKFLYRRGPTFTHNFRILLDAYIACYDKQDFIQKAHQGLLAQQAQE
jgi:hypothetical protein